MIPSASVHHLGIYRDKSTLQPVEYYNKLPAESNADHCIILDPMIATGGTAKAAIHMLKDWGAQSVSLVCICASMKGVQAIATKYPDVKIYTGVIDHDLNDDGYVVPGIGDAGDRLFKSSQ